jgi:hypothetical protein
MAPASFSDNHLRFLVGLQADIPVQHTANAAEQRSLAAEKAIQDARAAQIAANLRRDIELAFSGMASAAALVEQAERTRFVLQAKRDAEQSKLALARTDEVAVLRYDLELLAADGDRIAALKSARDAEAALRLILHAYPR